MHRARFVAIGGRARRWQKPDRLARLVIRMNTAQIIREAVAQVQAMRAESRAAPCIREGVMKVKRLQARRFAGTYADLFASPSYSAAARFFLEELYGDRNYADRDAQFARIATAVETLFPRDVADTAAALARLHALTESLDHDMARVGLNFTTAVPADRVELREGAQGSGGSGGSEGSEGGEGGEAAAYVRAWRAVARRNDRELQLANVLALGAEMSRLTRLPGLRMMLRMMRTPASAAGLGSLQRFLESGFETFAAVARVPGGVERFLATIREREERLMLSLFDGDSGPAAQDIRAALGRAAMR